MGTTDVLQQLFSRLTAYPVWEIALELGIIWLLAWMIWRFVEGTRAAGALKGILLILLGFLLLRLLAPAGSFERLSFLGDRFLGFAAIALVIVFQPEIRRAMIRIGETPFFSPQGSNVEPVIASVVKASEFLSKNRFGALIAIEGRVGLRELIERATPINADVSAELLQAIFWPNSPLHDMGVVIRGTSIMAAGVQFPLAEPADMPDKRLGTRHRAALGLARVTDTIVIVVSEETGAISLAHHGKLQRWLTTETLQDELYRRLSNIADSSLNGDAPNAETSVEEQV
ncbi:MAG: diadenylate cyclase CdaA [Phycisphaerales bacterium JB043]